MKKKAIYLLAWVYIILLLVLVINAFTFVYRIKSTLFIETILYYVLAFCAIASIYKSKNSMRFILCTLLLMLLSPYLLLFMPMFVLIPLTFTKDFSTKTKVIGGIGIGIGILTFVMFVITSAFQVPPVKSEIILSPNRNKALVSQYFETGNVLNVYFEQKLLNGVVTITRTLYTTNARNKIDMNWLDNNTVMINNQEINIYTTQLKAK